MWVIQHLPEWVFHFIFGAGLIGTIAGFVLSMIPVIKKYSIPIKVISLLVLALGVYLEGALSDNKEWELRVKEMEVKYELLYSMIPDFPIATVEFHTGKLIFGTLAGKNIVAMNGRFHYYEGYSMKEITFPVRVMKLLGIQKIIISNASGCLNPAYKKGDLMERVSDALKLKSFLKQTMLMS